MDKFPAASEDVGDGVGGAAAIAGDLAKPPSSRKRERRQQREPLDVKRKVVPAWGLTKKSEPVPAKFKSVRKVRKASIKDAAEAATTPPPPSPGCQAASRAHQSYKLKFIQKMTSKNQDPSDSPREAATLTRRQERGQLAGELRWLLSQLPRHLSRVSSAVHDLQLSSATETGHARAQWCEAMKLVKQAGILYDEMAALEPGKHTAELQQWYSPLSAACDLQTRLSHAEMAAASSGVGHCAPTAEARAAPPCP